MRAFRNNSGRSAPSTPERRQRQEAFTIRYDALYRWACRLTDNSVEAEDLLQDCYVAFVSTNTNACIENLDGYLRRMLTYMLRSKRMRETRYRVTQLDEACHIPSGINVLAEIEERERQRAIQRQLTEIRKFAKNRRTRLGRTKAGEIFILRYYENKSGSEVAKLTGSTRGAVDQFVLIARREIKKRFHLK